MSTVFTPGLPVHAIHFIGSFLFFLLVRSLLARSKFLRTNGNYIPQRSFLMRQVYLKRRLTIVAESEPADPLANGLFTCYFLMHSNRLHWLTLFGRSACCFCVLVSWASLQPTPWIPLV